tara:strand:+ start:113 stop:265 length:153 start_codon:yes stop_codon:yes gene_type:complete
MSYQKKLQHLISTGHSEAYTQSALWASFSRSHSIQTIAKDIETFKASLNK